MMERNIDIMGICETRLEGEGMEKIHNDFQLIHKGMNNERKYGVAFILAPNFADRVGKIDYVNERILGITLHLGKGKVSLIQVYAPHQGRPQEEKEFFYQELQDTMDIIEDVDKIILGDLNAHVGNNRNNIESVMGAFGIGEVNGDGENLIDFCIRNRLAIMNTFFKHRDTHKWSWYRWNTDRGDYVERSMIDLILTNNKKIFKDVKSIPSVSLDSDHRLVLAKMKIKLLRPLKKLVRERIKVERLKEQEIDRQYREKVSEARPKEHQETEDIEKEWENMKEKNIQIAKEVIETKRVSGGKKKKTLWWTEEVREAVKKKSVAFRKWMKRRNPESRAEYEAARNEAERVKTRAKREAWERLGNELEDDMQGTKKLVYSIAKSYRRKDESGVNTIKNKEGELLTEEDEVDERWKEYFSELLNPAEVERPIDEEVTPRTEPNSLITTNEIKDAIKLMKNGKSPGSDGIPVEILKGNEDIVKWLARVFNVAWSEGRVPSDWGKAIICKIFKNGDRTECKNYRGISLLSQVGKIYERVLEKRLRTAVEDKLEEGQYGFRPQRGTTDAIFTLKMIMEKNWEWDQHVYIAFVDLEKAFDRLPRKEIWETLEDPIYMIEPPLVRAIKSLYRNNVSAVRTQLRENNWFDVTEGVRQGGVISPLLFVLFMDRCMKRLRFGREVTTLAYADDIAIVTKSHTKLQDTLNAWNEEMNTSGMKINANKTEVMMMAREKEDFEIEIDGTKLKLVEDFKYLGVQINERCYMEKEITSRIEKYTNNLRLMYPLLKDRLIPSRVKVIIYKTILRPVLTYGSETWTLTTRLKSKVQAAEMRVVRLIKGVTRRDRLRNDDIREELDIESVLEFVDRSKLRWYGHIMRMDQERYPAKYFRWKPRGKRPVGRPRKRWRDGVREAIEARGLTIESVEEEELYEDRTWWRSFMRHHN